MSVEAAESTVIYGPWPSNVAPIRPHFGLRKPGLAHLAGLDQALDVALGRPEDREEQNRVKEESRVTRAARKAGEARQGIDPEEVMHVSDLMDEVAGKLREFTRKNSRANVSAIARDAETLSERLVQLAAEFGAI